jgi:hypothetical protein
MDPSRRGPSLCFIDGDSRQVECEAEGVFRLPGSSPEAYVFDTVIEALPDFSGKLAVALHQRFEDATRIAETLHSIRRLNRDSHLLFSQVGEALGLLPEPVVRSAFVAIWAQAYPDDARAISARVRNALPQQAVAAVSA